jgi:hypothetical protein
MREERVARPRRERTHEAKPETRPDGDRFVSPLLVLQRQAGNRAVGALLARDGDTDKADEGATNTTVLFPDPVGVVPVDSYQFVGGGEIALILPSSAKDPELMRLAHNGAFLDKVVISTPAMKIVIARAVIASVQQSGHGVLSVTIAGDVAYDRPQKEPPGSVDAPARP